MFNLLEAVCCNLDLELALHATDVDSSSFSKYSLELQNLPLLQAELEEAQQAQENFQRMATYVVLVGGAERNPRAVNLLKQAADKKIHVKALVSSNEYSSKGIQKNFIHRRKHRLENAEQQ